MRLDTGIKQISAAGRSGSGWKRKPGCDCKPTHLVADRHSNQEVGHRNALAAGLRRAPEVEHIDVRGDLVAAVPRKGGADHVEGPNPGGHQEARGA